MSGAPPLSPTDGTSLPPNPEAHKLIAYPWFDWLRFALASIVVLYHSGFTPFHLIDGGLAVKVFFALSGWLIGSILLRSERADLPRFFFNRATRIWIPYALAILLLYGFAAVREGVDFFWLKYLLLDVTFTHQLYAFFPAAGYEMPLDGSGNQFWSIAVEEQFYLVAPLVMLLLRWGKSLWVWALIAVATTLLDYHAGSVALGVCAAILERDHAISEQRLTRYVALAAAIASGIAIEFSATQYIIGPIFAVAVVVFFAIPGQRSEIALVAGGLSYPLYLNQWIGGFAINFVQKRWLPMHPAVDVILTFAFSVLMALILYWLVDRQIQLKRNGWYSRALGRQLGIIAYVLLGIGIVTGGLMHVYGPHGVPPLGPVETHP